MDIHIAAAILLALRVVSTSIYIYIIAAITYPNLTAENDPQVKPVRWSLFAMSLILLAGNIIPVLVDAGTLFAEVQRSSNQLSFAGTIYTFNNAIMSIVAAVAFLVLFIVSGQVNVRLKAQNKNLQADNDKMHRQHDS